MPREFEIRSEVTVAATPDEVWAAIATGPGLDSWFLGRTEVQGRLGGTVRWGTGERGVVATVTEHAPPRRFAYRSDTLDGQFMAFEWLVEGRDAGSTILRVVHSGFLGDDWADEYDAMSEGDQMYLGKLVTYLGHFRGRHGRPVTAAGPRVADRAHAWRLFHQGLGLTGPVTLGSRVRLTPRGLAAVDGTVDHLSPSFLGVRGPHGIYRFIHGYRGAVLLGHHLFQAGLDGDAAWQAWLNRTFSPSAW